MTTPRFLKLIVPLLVFLLFFNYNISFVFASPLVPNDPFFSEQWHLNKIQALGAWEKATGSLDVVVAVLDTGIDLDHPDLASRIWKNSREQLNGRDDDNNGYIDDIVGWDFIDNDNDPSPDVASPTLTRVGVNHGTLLAGVIGANAGNAEGVAGINWRVRLMPIRVLDSEGSGNTTTVEKGLRYAVAAGADVVNLSFVGKTFSNSLYSAVFDAWKAGVVVVAAAGNVAMTDKDLDAEPLYPACFQGPAGENIILGVAAVDRDDKLTSFSNSGTNCVDVSAPGSGIFSTQNQVAGNTIFHDAYGGGWSGTSAAAAVVSGVAALVKSLNRDLQPAEIIRLIIENSENIDRLNSAKAGKIGKGRVNAFLALQATEDYLRGQGRSFIKKGEVVVGPVNGRGLPVRIFDGFGPLVGELAGYGKDFKGGISISSGDTNGDGFRELVTVPTGGGGPHVRVWRSDGKLADEFFAYEKSFNGGAEVVFANLDGSGSEQIVTAPGAGREAQIRVWKRDGTLFNKFLAFPESYLGGAKVLAADFDKNGMDEIAVAPRGAYEPKIQIFRPDGILISSFSVAGSNYRGGIEFAVGDLNGDGWTEILTLEQRGNPKIRVWNYLGKELRPGFYLTPKTARGAQLTAGDLDGDGKAEILVGASQGASPTVKIYDANLRLRKEFLAYPKNERVGVAVAVVE